MLSRVNSFCLHEQDHRQLCNTPGILAHHIKFSNMDTIVRSKGIGLTIPHQLTFTTYQPCGGTHINDRLRESASHGQKKAKDIPRLIVPT